MTDRSDRQDGDGLQYALGALRTIAASSHDTSAKQLAALAQAGIDLVERGPDECAKMRGDQPTRDAAEGAQEYATLCHACGETLGSNESCDLPECPRRATTPKPAPDAMRGPLDSLLEVAIRAESNSASALKDDKQTWAAHARKVREAVADISIALTGAAEPVAWHCIFPSYGHLTLRLDEADQARIEGARVIPLYATPPVRGDQEAIARDQIRDVKVTIPQRDFAKASDEYLAGFHSGAKAQLDAILSFTVQSGAGEREALEPFATFGLDESGNDIRDGLMRDRICDWFGPSDFDAARAALLTRQAPQSSSPEKR